MNSPRSVKSRTVRPGRSLIRDKDKAASGASTPKREPEEEEEKPKLEDCATRSPAEATKANSAESESTSAKPDENEVEEPAVVSQQPARKQRERSLPARLLDSITPRSTIKKEEDSGGDDVNDQENESNSSQSVRSQRTRTRIPRERQEESDQQDSVRPARKRGKSRGEDKSNDDDEKVISFIFNMTFFELSYYRSPRPLARKRRKTAAAKMTLRRSRRRTKQIRN